MDSRRNWILVDASSPRANAPIRVGGRRFAPTYSGGDNEARISNINRLNDRIQRRLISGYSQVEIDGTGRGRIVGEENFSTAEGPSPSERLDSLIAQKDSMGEVEAIFERRRKPSAVSNRHEYKPPDPPKMWPLESEAIYAPVYQNPSTAQTAQDFPRFRHFRRRRSESVDSGSIRIRRRHQVIPRLVTASRSVEYVPDPSASMAHEYIRRAPITLRRPHYFYDKCDLCAFKIFRYGDHCPACGRTSTNFAKPSPRPDYSRNPVILSPRELIRDPWRMYRPPNPRVYTRNLPTARSRRVIYPAMKKPVFRYGSSLPEALYDYEVWAKKKDKRRTRRKAAALVLALLALALVVSAGVVLAATTH